MGSVPLREKGDDRLGHRITASPDSAVPLEGLTQLSKPLWTLGGCSLLLGKAVALSVLRDGPRDPELGAWLHHALPFLALEQDASGSHVCFISYVALLRALLGIYPLPSRTTVTS